MTKNYLKKSNFLLQTLVFATLLFSVTANAQCPVGNVTFNTQAQIDDFVIDYPTCTEILGNVSIIGNDITNLDGLSNITSIDGYLRLESNPILADLGGLSALNTISGYFLIAYQDSLTDLDGLSSLTSVGGYLEIILNTSLTNVNGLSSLTSINGYLSIDRNSSLTDISGLTNIDSNSIVGEWGLYIVDNPLLSVCDLSNFCEFISGSGERTIGGNSGNCLDEAAVTTQCNTLSIPSIDAPVFSYYPNPVKDVFNVSYGSQISDLSVINMLGQVVLTKNVESNDAQIDMSTLPNGNYFVRIVSEETIKTVKIVKL